MRWGVAGNPQSESVMSKTRSICTHMCQRKKVRNHGG